jgi:hypothetical protein
MSCDVSNEAELTSREEYSTDGLDVAFSEPFLVVSSGSCEIDGRRVRSID